VGYSDHFKLTDDLIAHIDSSLVTINDAFIASRYTGFVSVSAVTVFELAIKDIFRDFANAKHKVLGNFTAAYFERINGRIKIQVIKDDYAARYGDKYALRFDKVLNAREREVLDQQGVSMKAAYSNLIVWRNEFAHEGRVPQNATYTEVKRAYSLGKDVIGCLAKTMKR
jgi:hypothetical protein